MKPSPIPKKEPGPEHVRPIIRRVLSELEREDLKVIAVEPDLYPGIAE